ncbi:MAG: MtnX-like HAD-IB family phosphatase [Ignavibacteriae bacterium]|nr:MtnX-like HAD-IB family phosphatase [Ignavibacteriota bacterium]
MQNLQNKKFNIYIDFDGTITNIDVGEHMFIKFGDPQKCQSVIDEWVDGKISSVKVWIELCKTVKNFNETEFDKFLDEVELDPYFLEFVEYCKTNNFSTTILSDGLDYYINKISKKYKFDDLKIFSNKLLINENNSLIPSFPYGDEECKDCANCKRNHILNSSSEEDINIYIGDGYSDTCAAQHCDYIFAKRSLLKYCEKNRIPYFPFNNFNDVLKIVTQLANKKKIKKRHQASLKRRDAFMQG